MPKRAFLAAGVLFLAACESTTLPEGQSEQLSAADAQFLANAFEATTASLLDDFFGAGSFGLAPAPSLTHQPVVWEFSFERSRACHNGGTVSIAGSGTRTWDPEERTFDVASSGTKVREECGFTRGDVVITLTGKAEWTHKRHFANHEPTGQWVTTAVGGFDWSKSTGESGECSFELTRTVDTEENTVSLVGVFCDREIDRSRTWRD